MHASRIDAFGTTLDPAAPVRYLVARSGSALGDAAPATAAPVSEWLDRIDAARSALASTAGLPAPLAPAHGRAEIS